MFDIEVLQTTGCVIAYILINIAKRLTGVSYLLMTTYEN